MYIGGWVLGGVIGTIVQFQFTGMDIKSSDKDAKKSDETPYIELQDTAVKIEESEWIRQVYFAICLTMIHSRGYNLIYGAII